MTKDFEKDMGLGRELSTNTPADVLAGLPTQDIYPVAYDEFAAAVDTAGPITEGPRGPVGSHEGYKDNVLRQWLAFPKNFGGLLKLLVTGEKEPKQPAKRPTIPAGWRFPSDPNVIMTGVGVWHDPTNMISQQRRSIDGSDADHFNGRAIH